MNLMEIIVIVLIVFMAFSGLHRGFVKKISSIISLALTIVLSAVAQPYISDFILEHTSIYDFIDQQCSSVISRIFADQVIVETSESGEVSLSDLSREELKELMIEYGYESYTYAVDWLNDEELEEYKESFLEEYLSELSTGDTAGGGEQTESDSSKIIDSLQLPDTIKNMLHESDNPEGYARLNVSGIKDYLTEFFAVLILDIISFAVSFIVIMIAIRLVMFLLNIVAHFPKIGFLNRIGGMAVGILQALFIVWVFFMIVSVIQSTEVGEMLINMIEESTWLVWLYKSNLFWNIFTLIF